MSKSVPLPFAHRPLAMSAPGVTALEAMERYITEHPEQVAEAKRIFAARVTPSPVNVPVSPPAVPAESAPPMSRKATTRQHESEGIAEARRMGELHREQAAREAAHITPAMRKLAAKLGLDTPEGLDKLAAHAAEYRRGFQPESETVDSSQPAPRTISAEQAKADASLEQKMGLPKGSIAAHREELRKRLLSNGRL